jgi:hypothetical protein
MWLFTPFGFFSAVQKRGDAHLTVRARVGADLDRLREAYLPELSATVAGGGTDYPYRATVTHEAFGRALARVAADLHYSNFKSEVYAQQGAARANAYHHVWDALLELERENDAGEH